MLVYAEESGLPSQALASARDVLTEACAAMWRIVEASEAAADAMNVSDRAVQCLTASKRACVLSAPGSYYGTEYFAGQCLHILSLRKLSLEVQVLQERAVCTSSPVGDVTTGPTEAATDPDSDDD